VPQTVRSKGECPAQVKGRYHAHILQIRRVTAALGFAAPALALAKDIIVVSHGQANDPFGLAFKKGVDLAAQHTGANVDHRVPETFDMSAGCDQRRLAGAVLLR